MWQLPAHSLPASPDGTVLRAPRAKLAGYSRSSETWTKTLVIERTPDGGGTKDIVYIRGPGGELLTRIEEPGGGGVIANVDALIAEPGPKLSVAKSGRAPTAHSGVPLEPDGDLLQRLAPYDKRATVEDEFVFRRRFVLRRCCHRHRPTLYHGSRGIVTCASLTPR